MLSIQELVRETRQLSVHGIKTGSGVAPNFFTSGFSGIKGTINATSYNGMIQEVV